MQSGSESKESTKKSENYASEVTLLLEEIKKTNTLDHDVFASKMLAIWAEIDSKDVPASLSSDGQRIRSGLPPRGEQFSKKFFLFNTTCPTNIIDLIHDCWNSDPAERPSISQVTNILEELLAKFSATEKSAKQLTVSEAIKNGRLDEVDWLLSHGVKPDADSLNCAIMLNHRNLFEQLLKSGAPFNEDTLNCALLNPSFFIDVIDIPNISFNADTLHCSAISDDKFKKELAALGCTDKSNKSQIDVLAELTKKYGVPFFLFESKPQLYSQLESRKVDDPLLKQVFADRFAQVYKFDKEQHELDENLYSSVSSDIKKIYNNLIKGAGPAEEKQKIVLVSNFKQSDQGRFQQFWQEQTPLLAQQFNAIASEMVPPATGLAMRLYQLVANQRRVIAQELGQRHPTDGDIYGLIRERGKFRDIVLERDEWAKYYEPMRKYLRQYPNEELQLSEKMMNYEGKVTQVTLSIIEKIMAGKQSNAMLGDSYISHNKDQNGILLHSPHSDDKDCIFKRLDGLVKEALDLKVTKDNTDKFLFLLGSIMWYLGNYVPLLAGSANATEMFINSLLAAKQFSTEKYVMHEGVPWFFLCKITPRSEFVKAFPSHFEKTPQLISEMKLENVNPLPLKFFDKPSVQTQQANTIVDEPKPKNPLTP